VLTGELVADGKLYLDEDNLILDPDAIDPDNLETALTGFAGNWWAGLSLLHTLFAREHNRIVSLLPSSLSNEEKFQIARRVVGAEMQYITYTEFLPALGLTLSPYKGYNPSVNPSVSLEFATVGFRLHSIVNGEEEVEVGNSHYTPAQLEAIEAQGAGVIPIVTFEGNKPGYRIVIPQSVAFFDPDIVEDLGLGVQLQGLATGISSTGYRNDEQITNELRSVLFQLPGPGRNAFECFNEPELSECFTAVSDLGAIDAQRGFDHGTPSYNELRKAYGLAPQSTFAEVTGDSSEQLPAGDTIDTPAIMEFTALENYWHEPIPVNSSEDATYDARASTLASRLKTVYGSVENLDAFTGMLSEPVTTGGELGELQAAILRKQFEALRDGDRFFYLNDPVLEAIERKYGITYKHSLAEIISIDASVPKSSLPANVFFASTPPHHIYKRGYKNWVVSGSLTDRKAGRTITLPTGSTFDGSGEVNHETGAGLVTGSLAIPPFTATFKVSGHPIAVGFRLTQVGALAGSIMASEGLEALTIPVKLNVAISEVRLEGLSIPLHCSSSEPVSLNLADTLDLEELLTERWQFSGTFLLPKVSCEGGSRGAAFGAVLTALLSGPENTYSLAIAAG